jgi:DNA replication and repair protein RecF
LPLTRFTCTDFRCLETAALELDERFNLIVGPNASGKTSLLEGMSYLGRGRSFRGATTQNLIRHGSREFVLFGKARLAGRDLPIGVRNSRAGLEMQVDGARAQSAASLAEVLPLQVVDPDVHNLVAGGPDERRRYLDWIVFHVEQGYIDAWRRFRRALKQRNALLKDGVSDAELGGWDRELEATGLAVDAARARCVAIVGPAIRALGAGLLGSEVDIQYQRGWPADKSLAEAIAGSRERDRQLGSTQSGPHRADLRLVYDERQARRLVSRGQQKLLACALILAATRVVQEQADRPLLLLLDDPAAELDGGSLQRLMDAVVALECQVVATSLDAGERLFPGTPRMFHVEHGVLQDTR